jgi:inner membrane protein
LLILVELTMPTVFTHPAVPLALALGLGRNLVSTRLLLAGVVVATLPDLDVLGFRFGIAYASEWGHRGFTHSLCFAFVIAVLAAGLARALDSTAKRTFWFLLIAGASHGILDAFTNGGLGIAFFWPFSEQRYFAPVHPIEVAPISLTRIFSSQGLSVFGSEVLWVWLPCAGLALLALAYRRRYALPADLNTHRASTRRE